MQTGNFKCSRVIFNIWEEAFNENAVRRGGLGSDDGTGK